MSQTIELKVKVTIPDGKEWIARKTEEKLGWHDAMDLSTQDPDKKDKKFFRQNIAQAMGSTLVNSVKTVVNEYYGEGDSEEIVATIQSLEVEQSFSIS